MLAPIKKTFNQTVVPAVARSARGTADEAMAQALWIGPQDQGRRIVASAAARIPGALAVATVDLLTGNLLCVRAEESFSLGDLDTLGETTETLIGQSSLEQLNLELSASPEHDSNSCSDFHSDSFLISSDLVYYFVRLRSAPDIGLVIVAGFEATTEGLSFWECLRQGESSFFESTPRAIAHRSVN